MFGLSFCWTLYLWPCLYLLAKVTRFWAEICLFIIRSTEPPATKHPQSINDKPPDFTLVIRCFCHQACWRCAWPNCSAAMLPIAVLLTLAERLSILLRSSQECLSLIVQQLNFETWQPQESTKLYSSKTVHFGLFSSRLLSSIILPVSRCSFGGSLMYCGSWFKGSCA